MTLTKEEVLQYFSQLIVLGYMEKEVLEAFETNRIIEAKNSVGVSEDYVDTIALSVTYNKLSKMGPPRDVKFICIGKTATKMLKDRPVPYCTVYISQILNGALEPHNKIDVYGSDVSKVQDVNPMNVYQATLRLKNDGSFKLGESDTIKFVENVQADFDNYLNTLNINKVSVAWARNYRPELDSRGYPKKTELFCIVGRVTDSVTYAVKPSDTIKNSVFNIFDGSERAAVGKDRKGYALKPGIPCYVDPNFATLLNINGKFAVIGIISNNLKETPVETSMNGLSVYTIFSGESEGTGLEDR